MQLTTKGIEVEQYVGSRRTGEILPLSPLVKKSLTDFMTEPDARNVEYATEPAVCYGDLLTELLHNRNLLREFLRKDAPQMIKRIEEFDLLHLKPDFDTYMDSMECNEANSENCFTVLPGSCISHKFDQEFKFSDPNNPYYKVIRDRYQTSIVTASLHINFGMPDSESALQVSNMMRLIASQALGLSASSPFHNGQITGYQSYRWHSFPKTPVYVPIFKDLGHFITWNEDKIEHGEMFNVRHLWTSVRPNGPTRPKVLNRVELRIPDLIFDYCDLLALTSYLELRVLAFLERYENNQVPSFLSSECFDPVSILDQNEEAVAKNGLDAKVVDWETESEITLREQLTRDYERFIPEARKLEIMDTYSKFAELLEHGNFASYMLKSLDSKLGGKDDPELVDSCIREILIEESIKQEEKDLGLLSCEN